MGSDFEIRREYDREYPILLSADELKSALTTFKNSIELIKNSLDGVDFSVYFTSPGLYQLDKRRFFVLPRFISLPTNLENSDLSRYASRILLNLMELSYFGIDDRDRPKVDFNSLQREIEQELTCEELIHVCISYFNRPIIVELVKHNYFMEKTESVSYLKGRWRIDHDIRSGRESFTNFTCEYSDCDIDNAVFQLLRYYYERCIERYSNVTCLAATQSILDLLHSVQANSNPYSLINAARDLQQRDRRFDPLVPLLKHIEEFLFHDSQISLTSKDERDKTLHGFSYQFPMDDIFENIFRDLLQLSGVRFKSQHSLKILGGAELEYRKPGTEGVSNCDSEQASPIETRSANGKTITKPDFSILLKECLILCELKYKNLQVDISKEGKLSLTGLDRNDRNQMIGYLCSSVRKEEVPEGKKITSLVHAFVFPYPDIKATVPIHLTDLNSLNLRINFQSQLVFDSEKFSKTIKIPTANGKTDKNIIPVHFYFLPLEAYLSYSREEKRELGRQLFSHLLGLAGSD